MDADFDRELELASDAGIGYARSVLSFCGAVYLALALLLGPLLSAPLLLDDGAGTGLKVAMLAFNSLLAVVFSGGFAVVNFVAGSGLARGKKWAWVVAIGLGAIYLASACFPFGAVVLYGVLNEKTRKLFS